jgi:hypothetical protein
MCPLFCDMISTTLERDMTCRICSLFELSLTGVFHHWRPDRSSRELVLVWVAALAHTSYAREANSSLHLLDLEHPRFEKKIKNQQKFVSPSSCAIHFETATFESIESKDSAQKYLIRELNDSFSSWAEWFSSWDSNMTQALPGPVTESCGTVRFSLVLHSNNWKKTFTSSWHDNRNVLNQSSMDIGPFITNL